jgi:hypothetical protein
MTKPSSVLGLALLLAACSPPASQTSTDASSAGPDAASSALADAASSLGPDSGAGSLPDAGAACETDTELCARLSKTCGQLTAKDACQETRTVASCGTCAAPSTCGGSGVPNVCGAGSCKTWVVAKSGGDFTSVQAGLDAAAPCDIVLVRAGTYSENVSFPNSGSAAGGFITLQGEAGAVLDGTGKGPVGIAINGKTFLRVTGMTVQNYTSASTAATPMGISVKGAAGSLEITGNLVHHVEQPNGDAHGIAVYGDGATPIGNLLIDGNEIRDCRLGSSESMVLNGNVTDFVVSNNVVHDNDNIGIDFIGFEGTGPSGQDQARNGRCVGNRVFAISSAANPAYGGERSADGIYVDGGKDIVIERNRVDSCDIGIEVASEHGGKTTSGITVRDNFVSRSFQGNVMVGGYAASKGSAQDIAILNNTTWNGGDGEVVLQFNCSSLAVKNNVLVAKPGNEYVAESGGSNTAIGVESNLYFGASASSPGGFADAKAHYGDPQLVGAPGDLHVRPTSPAANAGVDLGNDASGKPLSGEKDVDGAARVQGGAIDLGAHEVK